MYVYLLKVSWKQMYSSFRVNSCIQLDGIWQLLSVYVTIVKYACMSYAQSNIYKHVRQFVRQRISIAKHYLQLGKPPWKLVEFKFESRPVFGFFRLATWVHACLTVSTEKSTLCERQKQWTRLMNSFKHAKVSSFIQSDLRIIQPQIGY